MPDGLWDALEAEAEEQNRSTAEHVRAILRSHIEADTQPNTQADTQAITKRLDKLEERLAHLEAANIERTREEMDVSVVDSDSGESKAAHAPRERVEVQEDANPSNMAGESPGDAPDDVRALVEGVATEEGWTDDGRREARIEAAVAALKVAHVRGSLGKSEALDELALNEEYPVQGQDGETWWRKNVRPVLQAVGDYNSGVFGYRVDLDAGDAPDDGGDVYDPTGEF